MKLKEEKGLTLIELLLYMALSATILAISTAFLFTLVEARIKNQTITEVEQQGIQVMQVITQTIRNAQVINSPTSGSSASALSLGVYNGALDPTTIDLSGGTIRIKEGVGSPIPLTNSRVVVSNLNFQNLSRVDTPGVIRTSFIISHLNPEGRQEYNFEKTFYATASLRQP